MGHIDKHLTLNLVLYYHYDTWMNEVMMKGAAIK